MSEDIFLPGFKGNPSRLVEKSLLFLHDTKVITLQNGLGVFRQAFSLSMEDLYISFPQGVARDHPTHEHLAALKTGDRIINPDRH